jgi:hypothetical protein
MGGEAFSTNDGNSFRSGDNNTEYLNFSMAPVNIDKCHSAVHIGGGGDGGGGLVQWGRTDKECVANAIAEAEKHVETRAMARCAGKTYREAVAFVKQPDGSFEPLKGNKKQKQAHCIKYTIEVTQGQISYLAQLLEEPEEPGKP